MPQEVITRITTLARCSHASRGLHFRHRGRKPTVRTNNIDTILTAGVYPDDKSSSNDSDSNNNADSSYLSDSNSDDDNDNDIVMQPTPMKILVTLTEK